MSSDIYVFDDDSFFPFSPFIDSPIDIVQEIPENDDEDINKKIPILQNPDDETNYLDQITPTLFSNSPPSHQLENLSLTQETYFQNVPNSGTQFADFLKTEDSQIPSLSGHDSQSFGPHSYGGAENVVKFMQRSYSSKSFDGKPHFLFQPRLDCLMENPYFQQQILSSHGSTFSSGQMRRVCSTGDLQVKTSVQASHHRLSSSPLATESSFIEEAAATAAANFKVGRYSAEERKERIHRYRAKRTQRNFNKTIKYACRKTLADSRPRIRGRFARNDETGEIPKIAAFNRYNEDEDDLWIDGYNDEDEGTVRGGTAFNILGPPTQLQYFGFS